MFRSMIIIREHMQFLAEVLKMLKLSVKHFVKEVWQHIVHKPFKCFNVCFRITQDILVHLLVLIISES
jgi:hypothetical protein